MVANFLRGMKAICSFTGFSEATVLKHKRQYPGMPINQQNGIWIGNPDALERFYKELAEGKTKKWLNAVADCSPLPTHQVNDTPQTEGAK